MNSATSAPRRFPWKIVRRGLLGLFLLCVVLGLYHSRLKPLPAGLSVASPPLTVPASQVHFYRDITYARSDQRVSEQVIYDRALKLIAEARDFLLVDLFLFNDYLGQESAAYRPLCAQVTEALLAKKRERPELTLVVISDPVNEAYGGALAPHFEALRAAGIPVVLTNLTRLRDSNPAYSAPWRLFAQIWGVAPGGKLPHPFSPSAGRVGLRAWLTLLNFKANHRKLVVADVPTPGGGRELTALIMSANPHDGSSAHGNVALEIRGDFAREVVRSEEAVLRFSGSPLELTARLPAASAPAAATVPEPVTVQLLTEGKIRDALLAAFAEAQAGDHIDVAMFYLAERRIVSALAAAAERGVRVRLVLDPNRDAFGYAKDGVPNRPVAAELMARGSGHLTVRWYATQGEQFHSKMALIRRQGQTTLIAGSANLTRRNIADLNLETNVSLQGAPEVSALAEAQAYFEQLWSNTGGEFTLPYDAYRDDSLRKRWKYRLQEATGLGTF